MQTQNPGKIFIVEDNALNMRLFTALLESHKYEVSGTTDGNIAIEMIRKFMPDLVLMDMQLNGMSGLDLIKTIKKDKYIGATKILVVTAFAMKDDRDKIIASGCDGYVAKPISVAPFLEQVASTIKKI